MPSRCPVCGKPPITVERMGIVVACTGLSPVVHTIHTGWKGSGREAFEDWEEICARIRRRAAEGLADPPPCGGT